MISKLKNNLLNLQATSVYNFNELTLTELLNKYFKVINECVDSANTSLNFLNWLKGEGLPNETIKELENMYNDGRLTDLINNLSGDLKLIVNNVDLKVDNLQNEVVANKEELELKLINKINQKDEEIKSSYLPNINIDGGLWNE